MFIRKWGPVFEQDMETGSGGGAVENKVIPTPPPQPADGPGSGRSKLRAQLETNLREATERDEGNQPPKKAKAPKSRAQQERELDASQDDAELDVELEPQVGEGEDEDQEQPQVAQAPASLSKEAKADWGKTPATVQAAFIKREKDVEAGVAQLKKNYADLDAVLAPRAEIMRQQGRTPAEAVNQLWLWFDALSMDPERIKVGQAPIALIALAHSFGIDLENRQLVDQQQQAQPKPGAQPGQPDLSDLPENVRAYVAQMQNQINQLGGMVQNGFQTFETTFQQNAMKETENIMTAWSQGKPYFEEVRKHMAYIIGSRMIPPRPDGTADLDTAYDMAIYAVPDVREKVLRDRRKAALDKRKQSEEAEKRAQQEAADKARRVGGGSLRPSSPGITVADDKVKKRGKSIRDSIADAVEELNGR